MRTALEMPYRLDAGDQLRVVVFGQPDLSNSFRVDGTGSVSMPLVGSIPARGRTTAELEDAIQSALSNGFLRDPSVSVEIETYRPFFVLGEARNPGQFPYVNGLTARTAVAIAGGFSPRAVTSEVIITRQYNGRIVEGRVPVNHPVVPGDTVQVIERWF